MAGSVCFGAFEFDPEHRVLRKHGLMIRVPGQSLEILAALVEHPGETLTRERIRTLLWPHGTVVEFEQSISAAIRRLRAAIGDPANNPRFIERVPQQGYRFIAPVQPLPPAPGRPPDIQPGAVFLHYRVMEKVGMGSMGEVWKAEDIKLGRTVALKFIPEYLAENDDALEAFRAEARHLAALDDPRICAIHGLEEQGGRWFLVMEYISGHSLNTVLAGEPLRLNRLVDIGVQASEALAAAHEAGIVHRDLKPANFMLNADGKLKLTDFGVARAVGGSDTSAVRTGRQSPTGTLEYMSPEQARGDPADPRSDLFSLGAVLYEMGTGKPPFRGDTAAAILHAIQFQTPARPRTLSSHLPRELERVILKALEKETAARWQDATELADALRSIQNARANRRRRLWRGLAAAIVLVVGLVPAWMWMRAKPVLGERDAIIIADFENTTGEALFDGALMQALRSQIGEAPRLSIVSEERIAQTLALSGRQPGAHLTRVVARDICQRLGGKAVLAGSVGKVGSRYTVGLEVVGCSEGDTLLSAYEEADSREHVLAGLSSEVTRIRGKLGESLASIRRLGAPVEATTRSLKALKEYSLALAEKARGNDARPLLQHAIQLDPDFASAWFTLALVYFNRGEELNVEEAMSRAYELRHHTSERERFLIETSYHALVSRDLPRSIASGTLAAQLYAHDAVARRAPFLAHCMAGEIDKALPIAQREMELAPGDGTTYFNLAIVLLIAQKPAEALAVLDRGRARGVNSDWYPFARYMAAALEGDFGAMDREAGSPPSVRLLALQAQTASYFGQLAKAVEIARVVERTAENNETTAAVQATVALGQVVVGREQEGRALARVALRLGVGRRSRLTAALALALAREPAAAEEALRDLLRRYPDDTILQAEWRQEIEGAAALSRGQPRRVLDEVPPIARSARRAWHSYLRGLACLQVGLPADAAAEFRKTLELKGLMFSDAAFYGAAEAYPAAQAGLARALAASGDIEASRCTYREFLDGWRWADSNVPLLVQARREYAVLMRR